MLAPGDSPTLGLSPQQEMSSGRPRARLWPSPVSPVLGHSRKVWGDQQLRSLWSLLPVPPSGSHGAGSKGQWLFWAQPGFRLPSEEGRPPAAVSGTLKREGGSRRAAGPALRPCYGDPAPRRWAGKVGTRPQEEDPLFVALLCFTVLSKGCTSPGRGRGVGAVVTQGSRAPAGQQRLILGGSRRSAGGL